MVPLQHMNEEIDKAFIAGVEKGHAEARETTRWIADMHREELPKMYAKGFEEGGVQKWLYGLELEYRRLGAEVRLVRAEDQRDRVYRQLTAVLGLFSEHKKVSYEQVSQAMEEAG